MYNDFFSKYENICVIGLGGIGSHLVDTLSRFLASVKTNSRVNFILCDGDDYSESNLSRQNFEAELVGENKAKSQRLVLESYYGKLIKYISEERYFNLENSEEVIPENTVVFSGVDNHATRKLIQERCALMKNVILISGGNDLTDGNVQYFEMLEGVQMGRRIDDEAYHPEIFTPKDKSPDDMSCEELEALGSEPQIVFTNERAASIMNCTFFARLEEKIDYQENHFDILTGNSKSYKRLLERKETQ
jgi:molybdopterin/thiamine biosynthesis adenylyltransferase